jgi:hypothetical protein
MPIMLGAKEHRAQDALEPRIFHNFSKLETPENLGVDYRCRTAVSCRHRA